MAFPQDPLDLTTELNINGTWTDVTADVRSDSGIVVSRGRSDEAGSVDPSRCNLVLDNRDGKYASKDPNSTYYGQLGRNLPMRVSVNQGDKYGYLPGDTTDYVSTPDSVGLSVTGDIDIRIEFDLNKEALLGTDVIELIGKYNTTGDQRSWVLLLVAPLSGTSTRYLRFRWSTAGTLASTVIPTYSTVPLPFTHNGRITARVTLDVNNGASGNDVKFYYTHSTDGVDSATWTQLGDTITTSGTTSIYDSTAPVRLGYVNSTITGVIPADINIYGAKILNGIGGTTVASPDFTTQTVGASTFDDAQGNTWTMQGNSEITNRKYRFHGEVSTWPQRWDPTGNNVWTPIEASGLLRRLGQGSTPVRSTLNRAYRESSAVVAYWPCEDGEDAEYIASGLEDGVAMEYKDATPTFASNEEFRCSDKLPVLNGAKLVGRVRNAAANSIQVRVVMKIPANDISAEATLFSVYTNGTAARWDFRVTTDGSINLDVYDSSGSLITTSSTYAFAVEGKLLELSFDLVEDGSDADFTISTLEVGATSGLQDNGTISSQSVNRCQRIVVNPDGDFTTTVIGHIAVQDTITSIFDNTDELNAYLGEPAGKRLQRLCDEQDIEFTVIGHLNDTSLMGYQRVKTLAQLLDECVNTDLGILYENRETTGLIYRTRYSLSNQITQLALDYTANDLSNLEPTEDDRYITNDVTVTRIDGASARAELSTGDLSTADPPTGIGRYDESVSISLSSDYQLENQAHWRLHLGTVDELRYQDVGINLARTQFSGDATAMQDALYLDIGDRITIANPPSWIAADGVSQLVQGTTEYMSNFEHTISMNTSPEAPHLIGIYDTDTPSLDVPARYAPAEDSTTLNADINTTTTSVAIAIAAGNPLWAYNDGDYDILVGGERMTVTAVSGTSSPQTLTVTRSVNGVVKSHTSGDAVIFFRPAHFAL